MQDIKAKIHSKYKKYEKYYPASFFVAGFLFDVVTLSRIDDPLSLIQQALYLVIIGVFLILRSLEYAGQFQSKFIVWKYNNEIVHFLFGSLLSLYMLLYFKSSSFFVSFGFLIVIFSLFVANELPHFQRQGPWLKFSLYALCCLSFFAIVVPTLLGFIGVIPLIVAEVLMLICTYFISRILIRKGLNEHEVTKSVFMPSAGVAAIFILLYFLKFLPPIPLSIQYIGIYHNVVKDQGSFILSYDRPWWKIWEDGAQTFMAQPGDKLNCFVRIFSPTGFEDKIYYHWMRENDRGDWESQDRIANAIVGGRDEGFRGFATKSNFSPGRWRVLIETEDQREIGRISFEVVPAELGPREFSTDKY